MNKIKEKLLKGCGKDLVCKGVVRYCATCKAKLQQHEETSKAKDEEFIKLLDEIVARNFKDEYGACIYFSDIEEIKQRIKEK